MIAMAATAKKLDIKIGDLVEIERRKYDVVSHKHGGVALEPAITMTVAEIHAEHGSRPLTPEEFEDYFGDLPSDGEGVTVPTSDVAYGESRRGSTPTSGGRRSNGWKRARRLESRRTRAHPDQ